MIECDIDAEYSIREKIQKDEEFRAEWNAFWSQYLWAERWVWTDEGKHFYLPTVTGVLSYEDMTAISRWGCRFKPSEKSSLMITTLHEKVKELGDDVRRLEKCQKLVGGAAVVIRVPDNILMSIKQVDYMPDACTQELQEKLDDGWLILAVCPPQAQRRPDYIIGRTDRVS